MAFVMKKKEKFLWPVKIKTPKDGGGYEEQSLSLEFKKMGNKELRELGKSKSEDLSDFAKAIVLGWKDVKDESGNELPFSPEFIP